MKIAVATTQGGLEDNVSPVFGRCATYTMVEVDDKEIKNVGVVPNQFAAAMGGAGIQAAQLVANQGALAVIAGNFGPNATAVLTQANVKMVQAQGNARDTVTKYINGELQAVSEPTGPRFGGMGMGRGGGLGMGQGRGRGGGMGRGRGMWQTPVVPQTPEQLTTPQTKEEEVAALENQSKIMEQQMKEIRNRIKELKVE